MQNPKEQSIYIYNVISYFSEVPNNSKCVGRDTYYMLSAKLLQINIA